MEIRWFRCGEEMIETRITPVGELPKTEDWPISLYIVHPWSMKDCIENGCDHCWSTRKKMIRDAKKK